jgi:hypothetical protein
MPFTLKNDGEEIQGMTRNVSLLGISAYSQTGIDQVQEVECHLQIPETSREIIANGTVTRCHPLQEPHPDGPFEVGVFFKSFEPKGELNLVEYLKAVSDKEQAEITVAYRELKKKLAARKRRKKTELLRKKKRRAERLRKRRLRLAAIARRKKSGGKKRGRKPKKKTASASKKSTSPKKRANKASSRS